MADLVLTTWDWVPERPRGYVRDLRVRWALEEAGLPYRVERVTPDDRARHLAHQPFAQVPWLTDGDVTLFESGAILLHLGERSEALMPAAPGARAEALSWAVAALNTVETAILPWLGLHLAGDPFEAPGPRGVLGRRDTRLGQLDAVLQGRHWLAGTFSLADILMADALRLVDRNDPAHPFAACRAHVARATDRPAFRKAHADQLAFYAEADARRAAASPAGVAG